MVGVVVGVVVEVEVVVEVVVEVGVEVGVGVEVEVEVVVEVVVEVTSPAMDPAEEAALPPRGEGVRYDDWLASVHWRYLHDADFHAAVEVMVRERLAKDRADRA